MRERSSVESPLHPNTAAPRQLEGKCRPFPLRPGTSCTSLADKTNDSPSAYGLSPRPSRLRGPTGLMPHVMHEPSEHS